MPEPDPDQAGQAAFLLRLSARPVILAGAGALDAGEEVAAIAHRINAPVVTTRGGKGLLADSDDMAAGALFGQPETAQMLAGADVLFAVGVGFDDAASQGLQLPAQMVQVDIDAEQLARHHPVRLGIEGDARAVLQQIITALDGPSPLKGAPGDRTVPGADAPEGLARDGSVRAKQLRGSVLERAFKEAPGQMAALETLREDIHPRALVVGMPGTSRQFTAPFFEIKQAGTWLSGDEPAELFETARERSKSQPVVVLCDSPDLAEHLDVLAGCRALTVIGFLHGGGKPTELMQTCLRAGFSTILVDTAEEITAALSVMFPAGSPSVILATFRWDSAGGA